MILHSLLLNSFFINLVRDVTNFEILNLLANFFGLIAVILKVVEYQLEKRLVRISLALVGNLCWISYFVLKGMNASAISGVIALTSNIVFMLSEKHNFFKSVWWLVVFLVMSAINCVVGYKVWMDIFAILAGLFGVIAYFVKNDKLYRILSFACMFSWLLNSVFYQAGIALVNDAFATVSVTIAILRKDLIKKKGVEKTEKEQTIT